MVQGLVNSFGTVVMAAFAAAVKIDAFAYMPVQDFGNAFSTFIAQNYGAKEKKRIQQGSKSGGSYICNFLCGGINVCVYILKTTYDDICGCKRNGYYNGRSPLLAHRRCILYWNRMAVFAVWSVSCFGQTGNECGTYGIFTWNTSGVGIYIVCNTGNRCGWRSGGQFQSDGRWQILWDCCIIKSKSKIWWKKSLRCDRVIKSKEYYYADIQRVFTYFS